MDIEHQIRRGRSRGIGISVVQSQRHGRRVAVPGLRQDISQARARAGSVIRSLQAAVSSCRCHAVEFPELQEIERDARVLYERLANLDPYAGEAPAARTARGPVTTKNNAPDL